MSDSIKFRVLTLSVAYAEKRNVRFIETSAKTNENVQEAFMMLLNEIAKTAIVENATDGVDKKEMTKATQQTVKLGKHWIYWILIYHTKEFLF